MQAEYSPKGLTDLRVPVSWSNPGGEWGGEEGGVGGGLWVVGGLHSVLTDGIDTRYNSAVKAGDRDVSGWRETSAKRDEGRGSGLE